MQGRGPRTETDSVLCPDSSCELLFELNNLGASREPVRLQNFNYRLHIRIVETLPPIRQQFVPHRLTPVDGKPIQSLRQGIHH